MGAGDSSSVELSSRRDFMERLGLGVIAAGAMACESNSLPGYVAGLDSEKPSPAITHKPQIYTPYPSHEKWQGIGDFERYPLWPFAGNLQSFDIAQPEWTAYYRSAGERGMSSRFPGRYGFYQIFVCRGEVKLGSVFTQGEPKTYVPGDFFSRWFTENEISRLESAPGTLLLVKYQSALAQSDYGISEKLHTARDNFDLPFISPHREESGRPFHVRSRFLLGDALRKTDRDMTVVTMLESFKDDTVAPSHYHPDPVWHEFVYLQGGHLTPDGYYAPGGHLVSLPEYKEGPYLATFDPYRAYPKEWPLYASASAFAVPTAAPWPKIFTGSQDGIYGVLFVHYGPFAKITPSRLANWTTLRAHELGPKG